MRPLHNRSLVNKEILLMTIHATEISIHHSFSMVIALMSLFIQLMSHQNNEKKNIIK
jgi:hypothetical protein